MRCGEVVGVDLEAVGRVQQDGCAVAGVGQHGAVGLDHRRSGLARSHQHDAAHEPDPLTRVESCEQVLDDDLRLLQMDVVVRLRVPADGGVGE